MQALFSLQLYYEKILTQASNLTIFKHVVLWNTPSTPYYEVRQAPSFYAARQARDFMKDAKHSILWSTSSMPFHEAREHVKYAKHANTQFSRLPHS